MNRSGFVRTLLVKLVKRRQEELTTYIEENPKADSKL